MTGISANQGEWYTTTCPDTDIQYTLPVRYQELVYVGRGACGVVVRATDTNTDEYVAIKKLLHPFQSPRQARRAYRELKLLIDLNHPDADIIQLYNVFTPDENLDDFRTLYFVFNFVNHDLDHVIKSQAKKGHLPFAEGHIRQIIYSVLRCLKYIHSAHVLHRDLRPSNIGTDQDSNITIFLYSGPFKEAVHINFRDFPDRNGSKYQKVPQVLDFGLARVALEEDVTPYLRVGPWRAPEVYINPSQYTEKLDIWSVGCIMGELILLHPVFCGNTQTDLLNNIFDIIGTPDITTLDRISIPGDVYNYISTLEPKSKQDFNELFGYKYDPETQVAISGISPTGVELLDLLLSFDHHKRPTAEKALAHPFFEGLHEPSDEPTTEPLVDQHSSAQFSVNEWKSIIWKMVQDFVPPPWIDDEDANTSAITVAKSPKMLFSTCLQMLLYLFVFCFIMVTCIYRNCDGFFSLKCTSS